MFRVETRSSSQPEVWFQAYPQSTLLKLQGEDPCLKQVAAWLRKGSRPSAKEICPASPEFRHYWNLWGTLDFKNELLIRHVYKKDGSYSHDQLLIPRALRQEALKACHDSVWSGHLGRRKTAAKLFRKYYWFESRSDIDVWVSQCDTCASVKSSNRKPKALVGDMRVGAPMDRLSIDLLGPLPESDKGNRYVLVVCDAFTKWAEAFPIPDQTARTCAQVLVNQVISRFGCPLNLHSDQGRQFESDLFKELCQLLQIHKTRTTPYRPQCNGQCERFNRTLLAMVKAYLDDRQEGWDQHISCLTAAYRSTPHESIGLTPNMMMLGREVQMPGELHIDACIEHMSPGEHCKTLRDSLLQAHELAREHLKKSVKSRISSNVRVSLHSYRPGDLAWYLNEERKVGLSPKLQPLYRGPVLILKKVSELDYKIQLERQGTIKLVHHDKLKPYKGNKNLPWAKRALITSS